MTLYPTGAVLAQGAVLYHNDIDFDKKKELNLLNREFDWGAMTERLKEAVRQPGKLFGKEERASLERESEMRQGQGRKR